MPNPDYREPFVLPFPKGMSREEIFANQWRNFRECPKCGAEKGDCCRSPFCVQLKYAVPNCRPKE
jgi:hypothetical protein